jgi:hypothetical protein
MTTLTLITAALTALAPRMQAPDTTYERLIREATTDPHFLPATVASMPSDPTLPSPLTYFGTIAGAPGVMHHASELYAYYRALGEASPRVRVETVGRTEEGREILLVIIADSATMGRLGEIKRGLAALADARTTDHAAMERLVDLIKPVYYIQGGLHSSEMGPPEMLTELAYRLAVSRDSSMRRIRRHVVVLINPVAEPDGRDRQVDWYYRYTKGRPDPEDGFPRSAPYWGKYAFHDNNRDGLQMALQLTHAINRVYYEWHPLVMHDLHESVPLLYVSTGTGPYNPTIDPITRTEWLTLANWDVQHVTQQGLPGVWTWAFFDGWWPGYAIWVANNHNEIGRFYETLGNAGADTQLRDLRGQMYAGDSVTTQQWYRQWPPTKKVYWSLRDNTNYSEAGVLAALDYTAQNAREMLSNFWQKGFNSIERGKTGPPYAFLIPAPEQQRDPRRVTYLVNQLLRNHIEVQRAADTLAGSFVIRLDQPYRDLAVNLLSRQHYPQSARYPPYDDIAWTLGLLYGVDVQLIDDASVFSWRGLKPVTDTVAYVATPRPNATAPGSVWLLRYRGQEELLPALYALKSREARATVAAAETTFTAADTVWDAGTVILDNLSARGAAWLGQQFGFPLVQTSAPTVRRHTLDLPRVAIYHTWYSTQDEGWARYWFDQLGIPYTDISKDELRGGKLKRRFDVILVPNASGDATQWIHGVNAKWSPLPYARTNQFPSHGLPASTTDMTGGPGFTGLAELQAFLDDGGTIVALENAARLVTQTGLVRQLREYQPQGLFHPGSIVTVQARRVADPIMYGFPDITHVFRGNGPLWQVSRRDRGLMVLQYGTEPLADERDTVVTEILGMPGKPARPQRQTDDSSSARHPSSSGVEGAHAYVLSGMVRNERQIIGQGAIFDVPAGKGNAGRVVVFTFNPLNRFLNHHDAPLVFNAILNWNDR